MNHNFKAYTDRVEMLEKYYAPHNPYGEMDEEKALSFLYKAMKNLNGNNCFADQTDYENLIRLEFEFADNKEIMNLIRRYKELLYDNYMKRLRLITKCAAAPKNIRYQECQLKNEENILLGNSRLTAYYIYEQQGWKGRRSGDTKANTKK